MRPVQEDTERVHITAACSPIPFLIATRSPRWARKSEAVDCQNIPVVPRPPLPELHGLRDRSVQGLFFVPPHHLLLPADSGCGRLRGGLSGPAAPQQWVFISSLRRGHDTIRAAQNVRAARGLVRAVVRRAQVRCYQTKMDPACARRDVSRIPNAISRKCWVEILCLADLLSLRADESLFALWYKKRSVNGPVRTLLGYLLMSANTPSTRGTVLFVMPVQKQRNRGASSPGAAD